MSKRKGKKGKRGGKLSGASTATKPITAAVESSAAPTQTAISSATRSPRAANPFSPSSPIAEGVKCCGNQEPVAVSQWANWLRGVAAKVGIYVLMLFGAYWIAAAWFSTWGFEGKKLFGTILWTLVGSAVMAVGWYLTNPEIDPTQQAKGEKGRPPPSASGHESKMVLGNIQLASLFLLGGIVGTVVLFKYELGGMAYVVVAGALAYGGVQTGIGLLDWFFGERSPTPV